MELHRKKISPKIRKTNLNIFINYIKIILYFVKKHHKNCKNSKKSTNKKPTQKDEIEREKKIKKKSIDPQNEAWALEPGMGGPMRLG